MLRQIHPDAEKDLADMLAKREGDINVVVSDLLLEMNIVCPEAYAVKVRAHKARKAAAELRVSKQAMQVDKKTSRRTQAEIEKLATEQKAEQAADQSASVPTETDDLEEEGAEPKESGSETEEEFEEFEDAADD